MSFPQNEKQHTDHGHIYRGRPQGGSAVWTFDFVAKRLCIACDPGVALQRCFGVGTARAHARLSHDIRKVSFPQNQKQRSDHGHICRGRPQGGSAALTFDFVAKRLRIACDPGSVLQRCFGVGRARTHARLSHRNRKVSFPQNEKQRINHGHICRGRPQGVQGDECCLAFDFVAKRLRIACDPGSALQRCFGVGRARTLVR